MRRLYQVGGDFLHLRRVIAQAEKNLRAGKHSPTFDTDEEVVAWLEKQGY